VHWYTMSKQSGNEWPGQGGGCECPGHAADVGVVFKEVLEELTRAAARRRRA